MPTFKEPARCLRWEQAQERKEAAIRYAGLNSDEDVASPEEPEAIRQDMYPNGEDEDWDRGRMHSGIK